MKKIIIIFLIILGGLFPAFSQITGPTTEICVGATYTYTYTSGGTCSIVWNVSGGVFPDYSNSTSATVSSSTTTINVTWTGTSASLQVLPCSGSWYTLNTYPTDFSLAVSPSSSLITSGNSVTLNATAFCTSYAWTCTGGSCALSSTTSASVNASPTVSKTYTVTATQDMTLNGGPVYTCTKTATAQVNVAPSGNTVCCDQAFCGSGDVAALTQQASTSLSGGSTPYTYQWQSSTNGGSSWSNISGATSASYDPGVVSSNILYRRIVNPGSAQSISNTVTVSVMPATLSLTTTSYSSNTTVKAVAVSITGDISTTSGALATIKGGQKIDINQVSTISANVLLAIEPCVDGMRLAAVGDVTVDQGADPNTLATTISTTAGAGIKPFPNPISEGMLNFGKNVNSYFLYDSKGQMVKTGTDAEGLNITGLQTGIYFLKADGQTQKIVVE